MEDNNKQLEGIIQNLDETNDDILESLQKEIQPVPKMDIEQEVHYVPTVQFADEEIPVETTPQTDNQSNDSVWDYYSSTMTTVPTFHRPTGNSNITPKKPKRRHIKHGNRKKK